MEVLDLNTGRKRPIRDGKPILSSAVAAWDGFFVEEDRALELELNDVCGLYHSISLVMETPMSFEWRSDGKSVSETISPGQICIVPARLPFSVRHPTGGRFVTVALEQHFLLSATSEMGGLEPIGPLCSLVTEDSFLRQLILGLHTEACNTRPEGRLYAESLASTLAMHLARKYSAQKPAVRDYRGGLTKFQLRRVVDFVQEHLSESISLTDLAGIAGRSPFHFARMFKHSTGMAPHQYLIRSRVIKAKELLQIRNADIADVAVQAGFCDQSHLAVHFKRICGLTPSAFVQRILPPEANSAPNGTPSRTDQTAAHAPSERDGHRNAKS